MGFLPALHIDINICPFRASWQAGGRCGIAHDRILLEHPLKFRYAGPAWRYLSIRRCFAAGARFRPSRTTYVASVRRSSNRRMKDASAICMSHVAAPDVVFRVPHDVLELTCEIAPHFVQLVSRHVVRRLSAGPNARLACQLRPRSDVSLLLLPNVTANDHCHASDTSRHYQFPGKVPGVGVRLASFPKDTQIVRRNRGPVAAS